MLQGKHDKSFQVREAWGRCQVLRKGFSQRLKSKLSVNKVITFPSLKFNQRQNYAFNSDYVQSNELILEVKVNFAIPFQPATACGHRVHKTLKSC